MKAVNFIGAGGTRPCEFCPNPVTCLEEGKCDRAEAVNILAVAESKGTLEPEEVCGCCNGTGWMVRDPDIGTDQECFCREFS